MDIQKPLLAPKVSLTQPDAKAPSATPMPVMTHVMLSVSIAAWTRRSTRPKAVMLVWESIATMPIGINANCIRATKPARANPLAPGALNIPAYGFCTTITRCVDGCPGHVYIRGVSIP